jgi:hypothetical protein
LDDDNAVQIHEMVSCEILRLFVAKFVQMSVNTMRAELVRIFAKQRQMANDKRQTGRKGSSSIDDQLSPQSAIDSHSSSLRHSSKSQPSNKKPDEVVGTV